MLRQMLIPQTPAEQNGLAVYVPVSIHDTRESTLIVGPTAVAGLWSSFQVNASAVITKCYVAAASGGGENIERTDLAGKTLSTLIEYVPPSNFAISYLNIASGSVIAKGF
jgi:hypothetical protein